jgi:hypothetical protein
MENVVAARGSWPAEQKGLRKEHVLRWKIRTGTNVQDDISRKDTGRNPSFFRATFRYPCLRTGDSIASSTQRFSDNVFDAEIDYHCEER